MVTIINFYLTTGGNVVLNFEDVYIHRSSFGASSFSGIFGYLNSWTFKIFSVIFLLWSLEKRNKMLIIISFIFIILLFMFSGHKSTLEALILILFFYFLYIFKNTSSIIIVSFFLLISICIFMGAVFNNNIFESLIIRRLLIVPAHLNFTYLDFFSNNDYIYWSNSILKSFFTYPYDLEMTHVIGEYLGYPKMGANTGFLASGYAQCGVIGVFSYTMFGIIIMNIINLLAKSYLKYFYMSMLFIPLLTLYTSSDFFTTLFTHGLLVAILILFFYDAKKYILKFGKFRLEI
ncbi:hypothetical protein [Campylobacter blaseri]|uniref:hypothetical protein n=1 Tax=Campylobacter blaseri TaxID=2042961 RepID=UPI0012FFDDC7|nr:hypothetical protein [Campylobacter blaseri]